MKRILALVMAMVMVLGMTAIAFAEDTPQIHVEGIKSGDTVYSYKVIKMDRTTGKWQWNITGMTDDELTEIVGHYDKEQGKYVTGSISEATAAKMANIVKGLTSSGTTATGETMDIDGDADAEEGLYCVLVTSGDVNTVYNPAFAAIQYTQDGADENEASTIDMATLTYSDTTKVKKSTITVTKKVTGNEGTDLGATEGKATTNKVGDTVTFTVNTTIPAFGQNFTSPKYIVSDSMSSGLEFQEITSITVGGSAVDTATGKVGETTYISNIDDDGTDGWTLTFDEGYLLTNNTTVPVVITYTAKVTNDALKNVNPDTNTVEVEFSNDPHDTGSSKTIKDETRHYTFSIDMDLLGNDEWETSEFVKIGVDNDGNPITESKTMDNGKVTNPLAGATFKITTDEAGENEYTNDNASSWVLTTDANGKIKITGLDAGTYYLHEVSAPDGYIPDKTPIPVEIAATYETINMDPDGKANSGDEYSYEALKSYTITIKGTTSSYTMTNSGAQKDKVVTSGDQTKEWINTKGVELPSTGGMGTTLFYIGGAVLVLGAVVVMITRRRVRG